MLVIPSVRRTVLVLLTGSICMLAAGQGEANSILFKIPDVVVSANSANPTSGTIHALLDLTGSYATNPPNVQSLNVAFELVGHPAGITFGAPQDPVDNRLIPSGVVFAGATDLPHTIRFAKDTGVATPAFDGALMVSVPFTVSAGLAAGTYPVRFITGNELGSSNAVPLPLTLVDGSIAVLPSGGFPAGDYNRNGVVDAADYGMWRNSLGQTGTGLAADGNANNVIDAADYSIWKSNFGRSTFASGSIAGTPEPSTWILLGGAIISLILPWRAAR
jgi:hypothetical protein